MKILFLTNRVLCSPLDILFSLLIFILSKSLHASPLQLTLLACLKPITSLFAFYASSYIIERPSKIRAYLVTQNLVGSLPCLFFPYVDTLWFYIASYAIFMVTLRAVYPAWIEVLKGWLSLQDLSPLLARGTSIHYLFSILLPPLICFYLDQQPTLWRYFFFGFSLLQLLSLGLILKVKLPLNATHAPTPPAWVSPFKMGWYLLGQKPFFAHYQLLFFLGGAGIIGTQPLLPLFFSDHLRLSYTQLAWAFSFCKGIAFILSSPYWAKLTSKISLYLLNVYVNLFTTLFFICILAASFYLPWLFVAYLFYGTMQGGCEMSWNLSGPLFSREKESILYSSLNLAFVGIRGCICPLLGYLFFNYTSAQAAFMLAAVISLLATAYGVWIDHKYKRVYSFNSI